ATTCNYHLAIFENDASGTRELVRSIDAGENWSSAGAADKVLSLATHPDAPGAAFAGSEGQGFFWNPAEGAPTAWFSLSEGLQGMKVLALAVDPVDPLFVHAGTAGAGLYRTADGGTTWFPVALGGTGNSPYPIHVTAILMDPDFPDTLYVGTAGGRIFEVCSNTFSISRTPWESGHAVNAIEIDRRTQDLYVGFENGIYVRQGGQSLLIEWNQTLADRRVTALAVDASADPAQVYLGTRGGDVYLSTSRGITWDQMSINWPGAEVSDLVVTQGTVPPVLLAAIDGAGVYRFDGSAGQWERNSTCLASLDVQDLVTSIHFPGRVYAATLDGLFRLDSPGDRWEAIGGEQGENPTFTVAVPPWGAYSLYAGFSRGARRVSITE
ncbi:MAG: hypothetical protein O6952_09695, partial [Planctomycetota bacterium]|nr:hypothetical protein [Planctomycetota bacterium]